MSSLLSSQKILALALFGSSVLISSAFLYQDISYKRELKAFEENFF